ncbi:hypothetical protein Tco_0436012 [Tanacetum coccineum]
MMDKAKTFKHHPKHKALYDALVASLIVDEDDMDIVFDTDEGILDIETNAEDIGHNSTLSAPVTNKPNWFKESPLPETLDSPDLDLSKEPSATADFDDILGTTFEFSNFFKHRLQKDTLTKADLEGPVYQLLKGTCRSCIELEYHLEQHYLTFFKQLDWINPEGDSTPKDFNNPLPLYGAPNRLYIQASHFFNKDLEYLRTRKLEEKKCSASTTKTRAIRYELYGVEEMVENLWSKSLVAYDKDAAYGIIGKQQGYAYLKGIIVKRANQKEYILKEADFPSLYLNDIEDMFLLYYQNKLYHLNGKIQTNLVVALRCFIRRTVIKYRVEDLQLGVESYQTKLNLIKPQVSAPGVNGQKPFAIFSIPKGVIYESRSGNICLMGEEEMCKFRDVTLVTVRDGLKTCLTNIMVGYDGDTLSRSWSKSYCKHAKSMVNVIEKTLYRRRMFCWWKEQ